MSVRMNRGYAIVDSIHAGSSEFVLGVHVNTPDNFVTWKCDKGTDYNFGHYHSDLLTAQKDLAERALKELEILRERERVLPIPRPKRQNGYER